MAIPVSQVITIASYIMKQKAAGKKRYPLVLMLEPLFRCNLTCAGCGKIQYPAEILRQHLSPEICFKAAEECGAPIVSIPGGEPLLHPEIGAIVRGLIARKKYVYLCTNALLLEEKLHLFRPSKYFTINVHLDGPGELHDRSVCLNGAYQRAVRAMRKAISLGFRVTTNTTLNKKSDPVSLRAFFDEMMNLGVEGMTLSPAYCYEKAPDQDYFLTRSEAVDLFARILADPKKSWRFNQSPLFLQFLTGRRDYSCTPWGMPTFNLFGWQKPCYLLQDGYCQSFTELMEETDWRKYGKESGNPRCADCMVHSGYEASAVNDTFSSLRGFWDSLKAMWSSS